MESSTKCSTVLLKTDTGANVNLMNSRTFDSLFDGNRKVLDPPSLRMEAYGNSAVEVLGKFHNFSDRRERSIDNYSMSLIQMFHPIFLRDGCYTLGVFRLCYSGIYKKFQQVPSNSINDAHTAYS